MTKQIKILIAVFLIILFFPKPCGRWTTAAALKVEQKCYGIKVSTGILPFVVGGGELYCFGIPSFSKKPTFNCNEPSDCISGCGWRATHGGVNGCIAVNKNSRDYLEHNNLKLEERFPVLCYENQCALEISVEEDILEFGVKEVIFSFKQENSSITPYSLDPLGYPIYLFQGPK